MHMPAKKNSCCSYSKLAITFYFSLFRKRNKDKKIIYLPEPFPVAIYAFISTGSWSFTNVNALMSGGNKKVKHT